MLKTITIAQAVAASSSYPVAFHPLLVKYNKNGKESIAAITDGGLYDNLGIPSSLLSPFILLLMINNENRNGCGEVAMLRRTWPSV